MQSVARVNRASFVFFVVLSTCFFLTCWPCCFFTWPSSQRGRQRVQANHLPLRNIFMSLGFGWTPMHWCSDPVLTMLIHFEVFTSWLGLLYIFTEPPYRAVWMGKHLLTVIRNVAIPWKTYRTQYELSLQCFCTSPDDVEYHQTPKRTLLIFITTMFFIHNFCMLYSKGP